MNTHSPAFDVNSWPIGNIFGIITPIIAPGEAATGKDGNLVQSFQNYLWQLILS